MGKKSKKGKSRANPHHGKAKRAAQVAKKRANSPNNETVAASIPSSNGTTAKANNEPKLVAESPDLGQQQLQSLVAAIMNQQNPKEIVTDVQKEKVEVAKEAVEVTVEETVNEEIVKEEPLKDHSATDTQKEEDKGMNIVQTKSEESLAIPEQLLANLHLFSPSQSKLANNLCKPPTNQPHIFENWSMETKDDDEKKIKIIQQLQRMDKAYPSGGLAGYVKNARELLERSKRGENPLEGWVPSVPDGEMFEIGTSNYNDFECVGLSEIGKCGFALVAGGLGERLGYGGIKLGLPTELATETTYLQYYIETILAIQSRYSNNIKLPLCIMVSNDTSAGTTKLLKDNNNFGMDDDQITIVQQGDGVPALMDNDATIAMDPSDPYKIQAKPHGHGDIHALLHSNGVAKSWCEKGLEWVIFFQDTNGLAFHTLPLALGVSKKRNLIMNSIAVPRKGKQAVGGVTKLKNTTTGQERTINVEYNQLDPLLRANGYPDGDVNDSKTGFSPFPGNINQLLFQLKPYTKALERTKGAMPEFVNPKYADDAKTIFKKPTRLECMMQDFPTILDSDESKQVGFTSIAADLCFSPVKNATADGVKLQAKGTAPGVAATGEADQYAAVRKIMRSIGCVVEDAKEAEYDGIKIVPGPEVVLKPSFVVCPAEYKKHFPNPTKIKISARSSLVVKGEGVVIESLELDGALVIDCEEGATGVIRGLVVNNVGWKKDTNVANDIAEFIRIRGYKMDKVETKHIIFKKDGSVIGLGGDPASPPKATVTSKSRGGNGSRPTPIKTTPATSSAPQVKAGSQQSSSLNDVPDLSRPSTPEANANTTECQSCCCIC